MRLSSVIAIAACLSAASPAFAQDEAKSGADPVKIHEETIAKEVAENWAKAPVKEQTTQFNGTVTVDGEDIAYKATAGTLTILNGEGKPSASMFYTAYTAEGENRPVTFFYNGGPGSASLWLRMGSFAPEAVMTDEPVTESPAPFKIEENPDSLIGTTDMVFIDAVGAGYSRALSGSKPSDFYGVDQDIDAFAKAITRYVTKYKRWNDPKYIFGESYGTTRTAGLVHVLESEGMQTNGIILLSTILNYGIDQSGYDDYYIGFLPTFAATAWYHKKVEDRPDDLDAFVEEARQFANGPYRTALAKGHDLTDEEEDEIARQLSRYSGLSPEYLKRTNLRIHDRRFRKELMREDGKTVGRLDGRYLGIDVDDAGERPEYDVSNTAIVGNYFSGMMDRLTTQFNYETGLQYRLSARPYGDWSWDFSHQPPTGWKQKIADTAVDLSAAMRANPHLKVLALNGYYDMATPFFATEYDLKHMMLPDNLIDNISYKYYDAGHMIYLNPKSRHQMRLDLEKFYENDED